MKKLLLLLLFIPGMVMAQSYGKIFETSTWNGSTYEHALYINEVIAIDDNYIQITSPDNQVFTFKALDHSGEQINSSGHRQIVITALDCTRNKVVTLRLVDRVSYMQLYIHFENGSRLVLNFTWV